jgi:uncharacterized protein (DUF302 family)
MKPIFGMLMALVLGSGYAQAAPVSASKKVIFSEAIDDITQAALNRDYRLVKVQEVDRALVKLGFADPGVRILFIGNPEQMRRALEQDVQLLALLPLRLTLKRDGDLVEISSDDLAPWAEQAANPESRKLVKSWQADLRMMLDDYSKAR